MDQSDERPHVIEFRNGTYFQGPEAKCGGQLHQAMRFGSRHLAIEYADREVPWVWFNGGMVVPA